MNFNRTCLTLAGVLFVPVILNAQAAKVVDLLNLSTDNEGIMRVYGAEGNGNFGVPVTGGTDFDGDGNMDLAVGYFTVTANGQSAAGKVHVILGGPTITGSVDLASTTDQFLTFEGTQFREALGSEVWMRDVTGDGIGDLLICRQNYTPNLGREGAGALTIIPGGPAVRSLVEERAIIRMDESDARLPRMDIIGANQFDRMGIWVRVGDVDGDGIGDIIVSADQNDERGNNAGEVWVIRGGSHLIPNSPLETIDLASPATSRLNGNIARILPPTQVGTVAAPFRTHLGSTLFARDMDGNGRAEVLMCSALSRAGASIRHPAGNTESYQATSSIRDGTLFIAWDDNFPQTTPWPDNFTIDLENPLGSVTTINGDGSKHRKFGEEIAAGYDFDGDNKSDLYVGDLEGDASPNRNRSTSGAGVVFYDAERLKGFNVDLDDPSTLPEGLRMTEFIGPIAGAIGSDTMAVGDFNLDGIDDLAIANPRDSPFGRIVAGTVHVIYGQPGGWPEVIDFAAGQLPPTSEVKITLLAGANGTIGGDIGDTLAYSADYGDMDGDGRMDLITNEMVGNGVLESARNVGNLIVVSGKLLDPDYVAPAAKELWMIY
ncbi:MAG: FG-GAP repeat protein [Sumerlaeia bacterium]